jgi:hypothetical protein
MTGFTISEASDVLPNLSYGQTLLCPGLDRHWCRHPETHPQLAKTPDLHGRYRTFSEPPTDIARLPFVRDQVGGTGSGITPLEIRPIPSFERTFHYPSTLLPLHFIFADPNPQLSTFLVAPVSPLHGALLV